MTACGLDFGTSNSAIGVMRGNAPALAPVEGSATLIPSAVFFDYENQGHVQFGGEAIASYIDQQEGRLMRALKSILGSSLINEKSKLGNRMVPLTEVVEIFVRHLKEKAEAFAGEDLTAAVLGRPVRFVDDDDAADAQAQRVLEGIAPRARRIQRFFEEEIAPLHGVRRVRCLGMVGAADLGDSGYRGARGPEVAEAARRLGAYLRPLGDTVYVAPPLDGIWASAPYLHNGSVPTLWHLMHPARRPTVWRRTPAGYDETRVGLEVEELENLPSGKVPPARRRTYFDTRKPGKSAAGHDFPDALTEDEKAAVLEYLKTL